MPRTAKLFSTAKPGGSLARRFSFCRQRGLYPARETTGDVILSRRPESWDGFFKLRRRPMFPMSSWPIAGMKPAETRVVLMAVRYLLDTNVASCIIKGSSPAVDRVW